MADQIIPQTNPLCFTTTPGIYQLVPDVSKCDVLSQLQTRLDQLSAMLTMTYGNGAETFESWSADIRENYLWGAAMLADECKELATHIE